MTGHWVIDGALEGANETLDRPLLQPLSGYHTVRGAFQHSLLSHSSLLPWAQAARLSGHGWKPLKEERKPFFQIHWLSQVFCHSNWELSACLLFLRHLIWQVRFFWSSLVMCALGFHNMRAISLVSASFKDLSLQFYTDFWWYCGSSSLFAWVYVVYIRIVQLSLQ